MTRVCRAVIIGGGVTGLTAAYHLQESGKPFEITLLEQSDRLGGCVFTERVDGFVMEHGADAFVARKPHALALCSLLDLPVQSPQTRTAYIRRPDGLVPLSGGFSGLVPAYPGTVLASPLLSLKGKARLLWEWMVPAGQDAAEESMEAFFVRRFGREAYTRVIAPLIGGLSGGDPAALSLDAHLPHLRIMENKHGSLLRAARHSPKPAGSALCSLRGGLGTLIDAMASRLQRVSICKSMPVQAVRRQGAGYVVETGSNKLHTADVVLIAVPAYAAASILAPLDAPLAEALGTIRYSAAIMVQLAYRSPDVPRVLDASGYIVAPDAGCKAVASTWSSVKFSGRAPDNHVLLRVVLARKRTDVAFAMDDEALTALACAELQDTLGVKAAPMLSRVHRWHRSLPQYALGHLERRAQIDDMRKAHSGLYLAGAAFNGTGIPDCIRSAQKAVDAILSDYTASDV